MKYGLTRLVLASTSFVDIYSNEYEKAKIAVSGLRGAVAIEEKFDLIVGNYLDLENDIFSIATRTMVGIGLQSTTEMRRALNFVINRRLANILRSFRGYLDQTPHQLPNIERLRLDGAEQLTSNFETSHTKSTIAALAPA